MIELRVNGKAVKVAAKGSTPLLDVLRNELALRGARFGCGEGLCGACTVIVDGKPVSSCDLPVEAVAGKSVETVEGLRSNGALHAVQQALVEEQAGQCGYCLTGIVMRAKALFDSNPKPTRAQIAEALDASLCRCGSQPRILRALEKLAKRGAAA